MIVNLLNNVSLAQRGDDGNWTQLIIFLVIGAFYLIRKLIQMAGEKISPKPEDSQPDHYEQAATDYEEVEVEQQEEYQQPVAIDTSENEAEVQARRAHQIALAKARGDFEARTAKILEYEERLRTARMNESVRQQWHEKLAIARKEAKAQHDSDRQVAQQKYVAATHNAKPAVAGQGSEPPRKPQQVTLPQPEPDTAFKHEQHAPAYNYDQHQLTSFSHKAEAVAPVKVNQAQKSTAANLSYHPNIPSLPFVSFTRTEMKRAIIFAEVLGKPVALREEYDSTSGF